MTLDEAIEYEKELAKEIYVEAMLCHANPDDGKLDDCIERGKYHEQLAEWLEELKMYKSLAPRELVSEKQKNDRAIEYSKGFDYGFKTGYNKAIDDFATKICEILEEYQTGFNMVSMANIWHFSRDLAEQLKAGITND